MKLKHEGLVLLAAVSSLTAIASTPQVALPQVALKDFREIPSFLSEMTGVSQADPEIRKRYGAVASRLPRTGGVLELKTPVVLSVMHLSSAYCDKMIARDLPRYSRDGIDFGLPPLAISDGL